MRTAEVESARSRNLAGESVGRKGMNGLTDPESSVEMVVAETLRGEADEDRVALSVGVAEVRKVLERRVREDVDRSEQRTQEDRRVSEQYQIDIKYIATLTCDRFAR